MSAQTTATVTTAALPFTPQRHRAIHEVKARLKRRGGDAVALHVLYNALRGLDPRRGFTAPRARGANTFQAFVQAAGRVPRLAQELAVELEPGMRSSLQSACRQAWLDNAHAAGQQQDQQGRRAAVITAMQHTPHGASSTVAEHGEDCARRYAALRSQLSSGRLDATAPKWLVAWRAQLLADQLSAFTMETYLRNHDIGKVTTLVRDEQGRCHFPGHAAESARLWRELGGTAQETRLMELDMVLHTQSAEDAAANVPGELLASLMLSTYAELLSNAQSIFGGTDSDSFKMKLKGLNKRATRLCEQRYAQAYQA